RPLGGPRPRRAGPVDGGRWCPPHAPRWSPGSGLEPSRRYRSRPYLRSGIVLSARNSAMSSTLPPSCVTVFGGIGICPEGSRNSCFGNQVFQVLHVPCGKVMQRRANGADSSADGAHACFDERDSEAFAAIANLQIGQHKAV